MTAPDPHAQFIGSIPETYDRCLGPVLFEGFAADLVRRLPVPAPRRVLELACGSGVVTRALRAALPAETTLTATDLNQAMVDHAAARVAGAVEWRTADMTALPFPDGSFDAVVCQFGVMFVPDPLVAFREARRVLAPGGAYLVNTWASFERNPFAHMTDATIASFFPSDPPRFYRTPFGFHDRDRFAALLAAADFHDVAIETVRVAPVDVDPEAFAFGLVHGNPVALEIQDRGTAPADAVARRLTEAFIAEFGPRPSRIALEAHVAVAKV